jgi:predicted TIM-barrel fold metal-dependent hydrolase
MLGPPLPLVNDLEGRRVPESLPTIVDAHVHLFPDQIFQAIVTWFAQYAWPIRYQMTAAGIVEFLLSRGVCHIVGLHYAHKPGIARWLNRHMADLCGRFPKVTGTATIFPGESEQVGILEEAFQMGLKGVKLHAHVQSFDMDSEAMQEVYEVCSKHDKPLVMHVGREPKSLDFPYPVDPYIICAAEKVERVLRAYPGLKVCVPHLGADEFTEYQRLLEKFDNLWLDIAMIMADYLPGTSTVHLSTMRSDRIMYGTDFPHISYAWDRELKRLCRLGLPEDMLEQVLGRNAARLFGIQVAR